VRFFRAPLHPLFLFDEQNLNIEFEEHAVSNSWKPDYAMNEVSYHVIIDLGKHYYISEVDLHDMHDVYNITLEYSSDETSWSTLLLTLAILIILEE
jgi:hypothetical protein